jgi:ABC-2 type transport system ATP-binding protein
MSPAVEIRGLTKHYPKVQALTDVDLTVEQGEFFALLGPNGAGKTTLISLLAGLSTPTAGSAHVLGFDVIKDYRQARRALGVVPQELVFDPFFSVRETLKLQAAYYGLKNSGRWIDELLENLDLTSKADANMRTLSGGMKRRVMVGQALVHKPQVIVLDEPTAGVDVELRQNLWAFIRTLNAQGHTIILTTHYLEEAQALCNRVAMLKAGQIVALDTTQNLLRGVTGISAQLSAAHLPTAWQSRGALQASGLHGLSLRDYGELEALLTACRTEGIEIKELKIGEADLEQAFLRIMGAPAAGALA